MKSEASRRGWRRTLRIALWVLLGIELVYLAAANIFLNFGILPGMLKDAQDDIVLEYHSAITLFPGLAIVHGLDLRGQDTNVEWQVTADDVTGFIALTGFAHKRFELVAAEVDGATFRLRARRQPEDLCTRAAAALPNIPGYFNAPEADAKNEKGCLAAAEKAPRVVKGGPPDPEKLWRAKLGRIHGEGLREVWIEGYRLRGDAEVRGGFELFPTQMVTVAPTGFVVRSGTVSEGRDTIAHDLEIEAGLRLEETDLTTTRGGALLGGFSVSSTVSAKLESFRFLNTLLGSVGAVRFTGGNGSLAGRIAIERGVIQPGSDLAVEASPIRAQILDLTASGRAKIDIEAERVGDETRGRLDLVLSKYSLHRKGEKDPHVEGQGLSLHAETRDLDLQKPFQDLRARLKLPTAKVGSFKDYARYVPPGLGLEIVSGNAEVEGELGLRSGDRVDTGNLDLRAQDILVRFEGLDIRGKLTLGARVQDGDLDEPRINLHGTRLELEDVALVQSEKGKAEVLSWWGKVTVPRGVLTPGEPTVLDADLHVTLKDIRPLLALFAAKTAVPKFALKFLDADDVEGDMHVEVGEDRVSVPSFHAKGDGLMVDAIFLNEAGRSRGAIRLDLGLLKLMIARDGSTTRFALFDTARAFMAERALFPKAEPRPVTTKSSSPARRSR